MSQDITTGATGRKASSMPVMTVDLAALFAELAESGTGPDNAHTVQEIIGKTGYSPEVTRRLIMRAQELGLCSVLYVPRKSIDGRMRQVPAYIFKAQEVGE